MRSNLKPVLMSVLFRGGGYDNQEQGPTLAQPARKRISTVPLSPNHRQCKILRPYATSCMWWRRTMCLVRWNAPQSKSHVLLCGLPCSWPGHVNLPPHLLVSLCSSVSAVLPSCMVIILCSWLCAHVPKDLSSPFRDNQNLCLPTTFLDRHHTFSSPPLLIFGPQYLKVP